MITDKEKRYMGVVQQSEYAWQQRQKWGKETLKKYKSAGEVLAEIKEYLKEASKSNPIEGYTSFNDYLKNGLEERQGIKRTTAYNHLFLYDNWEVVEHINLLGHENSYRLIASIKIIRWALEIKENDPERYKTLDASEYFKDQENKVKTLEENIKRFEKELGRALSYLTEEQKTKYAEFLLNN